MLSRPPRDSAASGMVETSPAPTTAATQTFAPPKMTAPGPRFSADDGWVGVASDGAGRRLPSSPALGGLVHSTVEVCLRSWMRCTAQALRKFWEQYRGGLRCALPIDRAADSRPRAPSRSTRRRRRACGAAGACASAARASAARAGRSRRATPAPAACTRAPPLRSSACSRRNSVIVERAPRAPSTRTTKAPGSISMRPARRTPSVASPSPPLRRR